MKRHYFKAGLELSLHNRLYVVERWTEDGDIQLRDTVTNTYTAYPISDLVENLFSGNLTVISRSDNAATRSQREFDNLSLLSEKSRIEAKRRFKYVMAIFEMKLTKYSIKMYEQVSIKIANEISDPKPPSPVTLYRWKREFENAGGDVRSLVPLKKPGNQKRKFGKMKNEPETRQNLEKSKEIYNIVQEVIDTEYLSKNRISVQATYDLILIKIHKINKYRNESEKLAIPSKTAIYKFINNIDPYTRDKSRLGKRIADKRYTQYGIGPRVQRPLERVDIDHTQLDVFVVDPRTRLPLGRPYYTSLIDRYSNMIIGRYISFTPPSTHSIMQCLKHAIRPKTYVREIYKNITNDWNCWGIPENIASDNGLEFLSGHYADACLELGINVDFMPVKKPWYKSIIENHFGVLNKKLLHRLPGNSFSEFLEIDEFDPSKNAVITFDALCEIIDTWIVDIYNQEPQRGYEHTGECRIPSILWNEGIKKFPPALPPNDIDLDILLRLIDFRSVDAGGIEFLGLRYNDPALALLRRKSAGKKIQIRYDSNDLSIIYAADAENGTYIPVPALDIKYAQNLTVYQHKIIKRYIRNYLNGAVNTHSLMEAKIRVQEIVNREFQLTKKIRSQSKIARFKNISSSQTVNSILKKNKDNAKSDFLKLAAYPENNDPADNPASFVEAVIDGLPEIKESELEPVKKNKTAKKNAKRKSKTKLHEEIETKINNESTEFLSENSLAGITQENENASFDIDTEWGVDFGFQIKK